jgi:hypothetical protein
LTLAGLKWGSGEPYTNLDLWSLRLNPRHNYGYGVLNPFISAAVTEVKPDSACDAPKDLECEIGMQRGVALLKMAPKPPSTTVSNATI